VTVGSVAIEEVLLLLKVLFLLLLYLFIWRIVRLASRDLRTPQESFVLAPLRAAAAPQASVQPVRSPGRLVVVSSPALSEGIVHELDSTPLTVGRGAQNHLPIQSDEFASAIHARFEPRKDGVWIVDEGSTNGTFVNGVQVEKPRRLEPGDVVRVGESDFRYEP
jgi:pSer/pThr/pTyr-binding forkhead associated (FHA) protein